MNLLSAGRRSFVICVVLLAAYWVVLCISTHLPPHSPVLHLVEGLWDKSLHFSAFAVLAALIALAWAVQRQDRHLGPPAEMTLSARFQRFFRQSIPPLNYVLIWIIAVAYGSVDEPTQPLFGRDCDYYDLLADSLGAAFGLLGFAILMRVGHWYFGGTQRPDDNPERTDRRTSHQRIIWGGSTWDRLLRNKKAAGNEKSPAALDVVD